MDVRHQIKSINDSDPVQLLPDFGDSVHFFVNFTVQNINESATIYIGSSNVASNDYGIKLIAGATATFEGFQRNAPLYAICDSGSASVAILRTSL
jgi:hypothetical protein